MKKVEALKKIAEGLNELIAIEEAAAKVDAPKSEEKPKKETPKAEKSAPKKEAPAKKVADDSENEGGNEDVDLNAMGYAELKAYAADLGLKAIGTKAQLIKKIEKALAEQGNSEESEKQEESESATEETADDSGEDDGEEADGLDDELKAKIDETFEGYTIEELREFVKELGLSTKGSREVLMSKIYDHADEIDFGDDEEGEQESSADDDSSEDGEDVSSDEAAEDDSEDEGEEGEEEMTEARAKAVEEWVAEQKQAFDDDELDVKEMKDFLKENFGVTFDKKAKPQDVLDSYIEHGVNFIDDEGNIVEEGVYSVNGEYYCCGTPLEIKKNKKGELSAICAVCGGKYEFDDEDDDE